MLLHSPSPLQALAELRVPVSGGCLCPLAHWSAFSLPGLGVAGPHTAHQMLVQPQPSSVRVCVCANASVRECVRVRAQVRACASVWQPPLHVRMDAALAVPDALISARVPLSPWRRKRGPSTDHYTPPLAHLSHSALGQCSFMPDLLSFGEILLTP